MNTQCRSCIFNWADNLIIRCWIVLSIGVLVCIWYVNHLKIVTHWKYLSLQSHCIIRSSDSRNTCVNTIEIFTLIAIVIIIPRKMNSPKTCCTENTENEVIIILRCLTDIKQNLTYLHFEMFAWRSSESKWIFILKKEWDTVVLTEISWRKKNTQKTWKSLYFVIRK